MNARAPLFGSTFFKAPNPTRQAGRGGSCASLKSNVRVVESINADTSQHIWAPIGGQRGHARLSAGGWASSRFHVTPSNSSLVPWLAFLGGPIGRPCTLATWLAMDRFDGRHRHGPVTRFELPTTGGGGLPAPTMLRLVCMAQHSTLNTRTHTNHHTHHIHRGLRAPTGWPAASVTPWRSVMPPGPLGSALGQRPPPCPNHHDDPQGWWRQSRQSRRQGTYCHCPHRLPRIELNRAD